ncbi:hypothetical protein [Kitasatospora sp. NPDC057500]|uniref:hypothetical protein n=1 Tax=Kitasatospora sp. NPDC057500 TaxID=3346151 RepID=UPI0036AF9C88
MLRAVRSFPLPVRLLPVDRLGVNTGVRLFIPRPAGRLGHDLGLRDPGRQGLLTVGGSAADRLGAGRDIIAGCAPRSVGSGLFALPGAARRATGWTGAAGQVLLTGSLADRTRQLRLTTRLQRRGPPSRRIPCGLDVAVDVALDAAGFLLLRLGLMPAQPFVLALVPAFGRSALGDTPAVRAVDSAATASRLLRAALGLVSAAVLARLHRTGRLPAPARPLPREAR